MSASILDTSTYTYPIPSWADGTSLFVGPTTPHAIDEICKAYADKIGTSGDLAFGDKVATYYAQLKAALGILKEILDGYNGIDTANLEGTFTILKSDKFYTDAQMMAGKRIDENCREGLLAYRHYLKTVVSALARIYDYLEDGRKALEALEGETDSDRAHTLITQLEIDEKFIYEEFQALRTHYKYNADTKQWDEMIDATFVSQLEKLNDAEGHLIDSEGNRIVQIADDDHTLGKYYQLSEDGKNLTTTVSVPVTVYLKNQAGKFIDMNGDEIEDEGIKDSTIEYKSDGPLGPGYYYGDVKVDTTPCFYEVFEDGQGNKFALFSECEVYENDNKWYTLDSKGRPLVKVKKPTVNLIRLGWMDEDGDMVEQWLDGGCENIPNYGKWFKLGASGDFTRNEGVPINEATPIPLRDDKDFLLTSEGDRIMKVDDDWYQLDSYGKLTMARSTFHYTFLQALRDTKIAYKDSTSETGERKDKPLTVFNSVTLLDRLRYIRYYYKLILQIGATDYSVFPDSAETGYPCLPNVESTEATKDTKNLGALEVFYVGYLIDRDGPINAVSSFFEVKTAALRNNLTLQSQKITALNMYLDFINRGMDVLNQSQSETDKKRRIPEGAIIALTYLCGQKMYNLFEAPNGHKYLVLPDLNPTHVGAYNLIRADDFGKNFFLGDSGSANDCAGNGACKMVKLERPGESPTPTYWHWAEAQQYGDESTELIPGESYSYSEVQGYYSSGKSGSGKYYNFLKEALGENSDGSFTFKLPTQLEVNTILPSSVKGYNEFDEDPEDSEAQEHTAMIESWTNALSNKTQYINTSIDTINTDVSVDRSKIDTLDSLTSTFRSRAQDVYLNTTANIRG